MKSCGNYQEFSVFSTDSVATLVHAFVNSRIDYRGSLLIGTPKKTTDKPQLPPGRWRAESALAESASLAERHRPFPVQGLCPGIQVSSCLHNMVPGYLSSLCQPLSSVSGLRHLCLTDCGKLDFPVSTWPRTGHGQVRGVETIYVLLVLSYFTF